MASPRGRLLAPQPFARQRRMKGNDAVKSRSCSMKPKHCYQTMGDNREKQQDIRKWIGSPQSNTSGTPSRRRRVMSTSDSEAEKETATPQDQLHQDDGNRQVPARAASGNSDPVSPEVIQLATTSEDSMNIPQSSRGGGAARPAERNNHGRRTRGQAINNRGKGTGGVGNKRTKKMKPKYCGEADETSDTGSATSNCNESDPDAQDLYRQAIRGVRNAGNARSNHRRSSMHCPVCAKFAEYLQHFL